MSVSRHPVRRNIATHSVAWTFGGCRGLIYYNYSLLIIVWIYKANRLGVTVHGRQRKRIFKLLPHNSTQIQVITAMLEMVAEHKALFFSFFFFNYCNAFLMGTLENAEIKFV